MATQFGKYTVERELGRGACGVTYRAVDPSLNRKVALKVLLQPASTQGAQGVGQTQTMERFAREARAAAAIHHPAVPQIYEVGQASGHCYIAMELCEGQTLKEMLAMQGPMHPTRATQIIRQVLLAIQAAHTLGITHRDVKPDNVMLMPDDTIKLLDFGIARVAGEETLTQTGSLLGTPAYMSPEQIMGRSIDGRSDLFSTGVMLHEMLTGRRPFEGQTLTQISHAIVYEEPQLGAALSAPLRDLIAMALEKDPDRRFPTARAMVDALDSGRSPRPTAVLPPTPGIPAPSATYAPSPGAHPPGMDATMVAGPGMIPGTPLPGQSAPLPPAAHLPAMAANANLRPCPSCGRAVSVYAPTCPGCGHPFGAVAAHPTHHPGYAVSYPGHPPYPAPHAVPPGYIRRPSNHSATVAVLWSLFCCSSAGQFYNGQIGKGMVLVFLTVAAAITVGWGYLLLVPIYAIDAGLIAGRLSRGEAVGEWQFF